MTSTISEPLATTLATTMLSCRYHGKRERVTVDTVPVPAIGEADALVRVVASGICRSDWHLWNGDWSWFGAKVPNPTTLGHEVGGVVERVGSGVKRIAPGTRVTIPFNIACGYCPYCREGRQNICDNPSSYFVTEGAGGWQQYMRVPTADLNCIPLPTGIDELTAAALGCRYMTAWRAVADRGAVHGGESLVVHGCGGVGLAAVQIGAALGARVIAVDIDDSKLALAKRSGAAETLNARGLNPMEVGGAVKKANGGPGADVAVDALGSSKTTLGALFSLRKGGRVSQVGLTSGEDKGSVTVPMDLVVLMELQIVGSYGNPHSAYPTLLGLVAAGRLKPKELVSREVGLEDVDSVLHDMDDFKTTGYVVITRF